MGMKPDEGQQATQKTLAYFDLSDFPLTVDELQRFGWQAHIDSPSPDGNGWSFRDGYYFLPSRDEIIQKRQQSEALSQKKLTIARRAAKLIRSVPFVRAILVCNSVAMGTARPESDIDFFIITAPKRVWIARLFTNLILKLFGLRVGRKTADKVCLCFFVDSDHLDLAHLKIADDDVYLIYWINMLVPVYDPESMHEKFLEANRWTNEFLPNRRKAITQRLRRYVGAADGADKIGFVGRIWKKIWEAMWRGAYGDLIEQQAKGFQLAKMRFSLKEKSRVDNKEVVLTDSIIKLHENDARRRIREQWLDKIKELAQSLPRHSA